MRLVLEPIFGLLACIAVYMGVYLVGKVTSEFRPDTEFERWCASKPMILAFRCKDVFEARHGLRALLAPHDEVVNLQGGVPWQYYRYDVVVRPISDDAIGVFIVSAIAQRGDWTKRRDAAELARALFAKGHVDEVWMHGQLHPSEAKSSARDQRAWLARVGEEGTLEVHPMIGRPLWAPTDA